MNIYAKGGSLRDARILFYGLRERNVMTWSAVIARYALQGGKGQNALGEVREKLARKGEEVKTVGTT